MNSDQPRPRRLPPSQPYKLSVLDRLIAPENDSSRPTLRYVREAVRRDLEDLLNSRPRCNGWPDSFRELDSSLANYGLPDFTGLGLGSPSSQRGFARVLCDVIRKFEPRLQNVTVEKSESADSQGRTAVFRIEATLCVEPIREPIVFDSTIEPQTASFHVTSIS
jgi:type VI secretion system protein ImpF